MDSSLSTTLARPWGAMAVHEWPGEGPVCLFLHGNGCAARDWELVRRHLQTPIRTVAIDFPGHGESAAPTIPFCMADLAEDTLAVIEARKLENVVLVGHSLGGMVAIEVAHRSSAVTKLILVEGWTSRAAWDAFCFSEHHYGRLSKDVIADIEKTAEEVQGRIPRNIRELFWQSVCAFDGFEMLTQLAIPVVEFYGTAGQRQDTLNRLAIPDLPHIRIQWVEGAGHFLIHERPTEMAALCEKIRKAAMHSQSRSVLE